MDDNLETTGRVLALWNERAALGAAAGTNDLTAKQLEMEALRAFIKPGQSVLDAGCGNGATALYLAGQIPLKIHGMDFSPEMIAAANAELEKRHFADSQVSFSVGNVKEAAALPERYDIVLTERVLINLGAWEEQREAIRGLVGLLKPGGKYLMCENFRDGLDNLNVLRERVGLPSVQSPWHNRYLQRDELATIDFAAKVEEVDFSSPYYFMSRVVNAWLAKEEGREPSYDAPVNRLALFLNDVPALRGLNVGQTRIWVWQSAGALDKEPQ